MKNCDCPHFLLPSENKLLCFGFRVADSSCVHSESPPPSLLTTVDMDELSRLTQALIDARLGASIYGIHLSVLSRLPAHRLKKTAIPNIGLIELVSGKAFEQSYSSLYENSFHGGEREGSELIARRLRDDFAGRRRGLAPFRIVGLRGKQGQAIAAAHFSVLFLRDRKHALPYLQYIWVRPGNRRQDLSELLHTFVLAVTVADTRRLKCVDKPMVPFTLFETEPAGRGPGAAVHDKAAARTIIHSKSGSLALMLERSDGSTISAHAQPGLEIGDPPLTYMWALRANPAVDLVLEDEQMGCAVLAAYYQCLRDEGFPEENIALAECIANRRTGHSERFCLRPLTDVREEMYIDIDARMNNE